MDIIYNVDFAILQFFQSLHNNVLNHIMQAFTFLGDKGLIWIALTIVLICIPKTRKIGVYMAISLIIEVILNDGIIKQIIQRNRPFLQMTGIDTIIKQPSGYSFPSGHTASSFAAATALFLHNKRWGIAAYIMAACIALSRMYFFVHFPSDILCGMLLGIIVGLLTYKLLNHLNEKIKLKKASNQP